MEDIHTVNRCLEAADNDLTQKFGHPELPVVAIAGIPRSGKTFIQQYIISVSDIGYISNVQGKFYLAPYLGSLIEKELLHEGYTSNHSYFHGITTGVHEPNEWGWFWQKWLNVSHENCYIEDPSRVDFKGLAAKFAAMENAKGKPVMFQNIMATINLKYLKQCFPNLVVVYMKRDPVFQLNSHIRGKLEASRNEQVRQKKANFGAMIDFRPRGFENFNSSGFVEDAAISIKLLTEEIETTLDTCFDPGEVLRVDFDRAKSAPQAFMEKFIRLLKNKGYELKVRQEAFEELTSFPARNNPEYLLDEYIGEIRHLCEKYFTV